MDNQELFDRVVRHLLTQGVRSTNEVDGSFLCAYRNEDGLQCAIGCLIPPDLYDPEFEGLHVVSSSPLGERLRTVTRLAYHNLALARSLQMVHDQIEPYQWSKKLRELAELFGLDDAEVERGYA